MKSLKVLSIGNSFSISAGEFFPNFVLASGNAVKFVSACIGGCSFERHAECLKQCDADPSLKPYDYSVWYNAAGKIIKDWIPSGSVNQMLKDDNFDIVTIQQASHFSWRPETYQPFADELIARIRKEQPQAEIMIQQTWSYRSQDRRFNAEWPVDQTGMFEHLDNAYRLLAEHTGFRRIPTGLAVQIARTKSPVKFQKISAEELVEYRWPDLPRQNGDVVGSMGWIKNEEGTLVITQDNIHLNRRGQYLQAAVWYGAMYGTDPRKVVWSPRSTGEPHFEFAAGNPVNVPWGDSIIDDKDAEFLRECAFEALVQEGYKL